MDKLNIYVCENYYPEFRKVIDKQNFTDVIVIPYPNMCGNKAKKKDVQKLFEDNSNTADKGLVICSKSCDVMKIVSEIPLIDILQSNYCFSHLANEQFINYILQRGGYIIGLGWLNNWRNHINIAGFDRDTARSFYKEFCKELIFFDAGIDQNAEIQLKELSEFLNLPYSIIPYELESIQTMIKSVVFEWRLNNKNDNCAKSILEIQSKCAEYSAILDLLSKISSYNNKRDAIERIKEIFIMVFGAQNFKFWNKNYDNESLPHEIVDLLSDKDKSVVLIKEQNRFCIKIEQSEKVFGVIDVSDFLFPQYIEKYLNFAIEISNISGMALLNIDHYECQ